MMRTQIRRYPYRDGASVHHQVHGLCLSLITFIALALCLLLARGEAVLASIKISPSGAANDLRQRRTISTISVESPDAFDTLRVDLASLDDEATSISFPGGNSSIFEVSLLLDDKITTYRLADLKTFIALSNGSAVIPTNMDEGFAVLLAMHHFNFMHDLGHPVLGDYVSRHPEIASCNVRLTMELFDSQISPTKTTQTFTSVWRRPVSIRTPPTTAVVGSSRSSETLPLSIFTAVNFIPQVSATSTATDFDNKEQHPLFGRTVTSTKGEAAVAARFFQSIGSTHVAILFVTDAYGSALQKSFRDETYEIGIATESFAYGSSASVEELVSVMAALKKSQFRHVYTICFEEKLLNILNAAVKADTIGANYLYTFPTVDPLSLEELLRSGHDDFKGSPLSKALHGTGFIQMQGGISTTRLRQGTPSTPVFNDTATTSFDRFRLSWRDAVNDQTIIKYIRSKFPASMVDMAGYERAIEFNRDPNGFLNFNYDVVTALGLAMCRAGENKTFFTGDDIYAQFRQLDFDGASGRVRIIPETGTRDYTTMTFVMWNVVIVSDVDSALEYILSVQFEQDKWIGVPGNAFVFADGTTVAPESLPTTSFNFNYIGTTSRSVGYAVAGIVIVAAIVSAVWTMCHVSDHVVDSSQPLFLLLISAGAIMMASSVFPLGIDESLVTSMQGLDTACMAVPWLYFIGTSIALGGLLAKTKAVYKAYVDPEIKEIQVTAGDVFLFTGGLVTVNSIALLVWSVSSPLTWTRQAKNTTDIYSRQLESYAVCTDGNSLGFAVVLIAINFGFLLMGTVWAYRTRNIATEYNESRFIGLTIAAILQAWSMGIPVLIIVHGIPSGSFFVKAGLIVLTSGILLFFIYVPKVLFARKAAWLAKQPQRPAKTFTRNPDKPQSAESDDSLGNQGYQLPSPEERPTGKRHSLKIIHNPRSSVNLSISGGIEFSKRQLEMFREAEDSISKRHLEVFHEEEDNIHGLSQSELGDLEEEDNIHGLSQAELDDLDEQDDAFEAQMRASYESLPITNETHGDSGHERSTREDESNGILTSAQPK